MLKLPVSLALTPSLLLAGAATVSCSRAEQNSPRSAPVSLVPELLDLPLIPFGGSGRGEFHLRNEGLKDLLITGIGPITCDCNVVDLALPDRPPGEPQPRAEERGMHLALHPGEELRIGIKLDTSRYREPVTWKTGRIPLSFQDFDYLPLDYRADIWVPFWIEPWALDLGQVGVRQRATGTVLVQGQEEADFQLLAPDAEEGWEIQVEALLNPGHKALYRVSVRAPAELPQGPFRQEFHLATDLSGAPPVRFAVTGVAVPDLVHDPRRLIFRSGALQPQSLSLRLLAANRTLAPPRLRFEGESGAGFRAELVELDAGRAWRIVVTPPAQAPPGRSAVRLVIESQDPETPRIDVPLMFLPQRQP